MKAKKILEFFLKGYAPENEDIEEAILEIDKLNSRNCEDCIYCEEFYKQYLDDIEFWYKCKNLKNPNIINITDIKTFYCNKWEQK